MSKANGARLIIVDCQLLQTADRHRGMGLFLYSLLSERALLKPASVKWLFLTNTAMPALDAKDARLLKSMGEIVDVGLLSKKGKATFGEAATTNRSGIDKALAPVLKNHDGPATFFIPALFSDEIFPVFPTRGTANIMLFHDLIPYLYHENYFGDADSERFKDYAQRFTEFYKTDLFVTNSQTTADDLIVYFGVDPNRVAALLGSGANRKELKPRQPELAKGLTDFILMPSGDDYRKNNALAAQALAELDSGMKLVITSNFSKQTQRQLRDIYSDTVFTGSVADEEYLWLVDHAAAVLFPTEYEGLGMPVLEAAEQGAKIICSSIPVFIEISPTAFFYFDPKSVASLTSALTQALGDNSAEAAKQRRQDYAEIADRFSWEKAAKRFMTAVDNVEPNPTVTKKLAVFCPSPASYSAIGKYVFELHAELSRHFDIDYYAEEGFTAFEPTRPNILKYAANYYAPERFAKQADRYDHVLYNLGNSEFHTDTILNALRSSGNAIVHDTKLNGIFDYMTNRGILTPERRQYETLLDESFETKDSVCLVSLATNQKALFCHSAFAGDALNEIVHDQSVAVNELMLPAGVPDIELPREKFTVCFAGIISENKGINLVSQIGQLGVQVNVFGFGVLGNSPLLKDLGSNVQVLHDLSDKEFQTALRQANVLVNFRLNYQGETSLSTLEAMRYGTVVIVNDIGWYSELPDDAVIKVHNEAEVTAAVQKLASDPAKCHEIGAAARNYMLQKHSHQTYAQVLKEKVK